MTSITASTATTTMSDASKSVSSNSIAAATSTPAEAVSSTDASTTTASSSSTTRPSAPAGSLGLPAHNSTYKRHEYWEQRFSQEEKYEWLSGYGAVRELLTPLIKKTDKILHLGCGNSDLSRDMYHDGYHHITNIDFSAACIEAQRHRNSDCPEMTWLVMDMLALDFDTASFDIVLDKCTLDALVVDEGDVWNPRDEVRQQVDQVLTGISRILKPSTGLYLQLSFGQPIHRLNHYFEKEKYGWEVSVRNWGEEKGFGYFFYIMKRTLDLEKLKAYYALKAQRQLEDDERMRILTEQQQAAYESENEEQQEAGMMALELDD